MFNNDSAVCGTKDPKMLVAPTKGADRSQTRVHIVEVYPNKRLFSGVTISVVHVINIERVVLIAIFEAIDVTMRRTSR
mgnify:CR=1 FL=1